MALSSVGRALQSCGVTRAAIATTLKSEGHLKMRELVEQELYVEDETENWICINVYATKATDPVRHRLAFNLLAKELHLSRAEIRIMALKDLVDIVKGESERFTVDALMGLEMLFVTDFYEDGAPFPLDPYDAMLVRAFVKKFVEEDLGFCTMTELPLNKCTKWWPQNFLALLDNQKNSASFKVE